VDQEHGRPAERLHWQKVAADHERRAGKCRRQRRRESDQVVAVGPDAVHKYYELACRIVGPRRHAGPGKQRHGHSGAPGA
jgi:hypothetical protein